MRIILEIVTFHTPVDSLEITESKEQQIRSMIDDFLVNSWEQFEKTEINNTLYGISIYKHKNVILTISIKQDDEMRDYILPHCDIRVEMNDANISKDIVEDFLNTIIRFFSGTLTREYFIDYDSTYQIDTMNQWKKYTIEDIKKIDMNDLYNSKNKNLLDAILYLHYTLKEQILALGIEQIDLDNFLQKNTESNSIKNVLLLSRERTNITTENLFINIQILHKQIQILLGYFIHKP